VEKKDVAIGVWFELDRFINSRIGALGEFRELIPKVSAVWSRQDNVPAGSDELCHLSEKVIGMGYMLDDLGNQDRIKQEGEIHFERVPWSEAKNSALMLLLHVIRQFVPQIIPGNDVTDFGERKGEVPLGCGYIQNPRTRLQHFGDEFQSATAPVVVTVGVTAVAGLAINLLQIVEVGFFPGFWPIVARMQSLHSGRS
jgi:hypothetical protein